MLSKADIGRLKAMLRRLEKSEEACQSLGLAVSPRSARACDLKDAATLRRVIAKAESGAPADDAPAQAASLYVEGMKRAHYAEDGAAVGRDWTAGTVLAGHSGMRPMTDAELAQVVASDALPHRIDDTALQIACSRVTRAYESTKQQRELDDCLSRGIAETEAGRDALRDALRHIACTCRASRTSTRRLRWIEQRAEWALAGRAYDDQAFDLPKDATHSTEKLAAKIRRLREIVTTPHETKEALAERVRRVLDDDQ